MEKKSLTQNDIINQIVTEDVKKKGQNHDRNTDIDDWNHICCFSSC